MWLAFTDVFHPTDQSIAERLFKLLHRNWGNGVLSTAIEVGIPLYQGSTLSINGSLLLPKV